MIEQKHIDMVFDLLKSPKLIMESLDTQKIDAIHAAIGISGEAGELLDAIKKYVIYNKKVDLDNIIEELGDIEFYLQALRQTFCISRRETLKKNMDKLLTGENARYKDGGYSDEQAAERRDKKISSKQG